MDFTDQITERKKFYQKFNFTSINDAIVNNYKVIVKTKEDNLASYYKVVRVEREVMEQAKEALENANIEANLDNIRLLVRNYYRNNLDLNVKLNEEEMNNKLEELINNETNGSKYPLLRDIIPNDYVEGKEYKVIKKKFVKDTFWG